MMTEPRSLRVAVLSSTRFGRYCIEKGILPVDGISIAGILTTPPEISISYSERPVNISTHACFDDLALRADCEVEILSGTVKADSYLAPLKRWKPDLLLALGWYYLLPRVVRETAPLGCAGIHASLLPRYRGGAPIPWAIINGEKETGVSFFYLEEGVDSGDVIAQERIEIGDADTCASVYARAEEASARLLRRHLPLLAAGTAARVRQNETAASNYPQRKPEDGEIDWSWPVHRVYNFIRAQTKPYPGAFTYVDGRRLTIWTAQPAPAAPTAALPTPSPVAPLAAPTAALPAAPTAPPRVAPHGTLLKGDEGLFVRCGDGWLHAREVEIFGADRGTLPVLSRAISTREVVA